MMTDLKTLYEEDTVAWAENQAAALRAAAQGGSNQALDWENLAEEIDDLAKSQRRALQSQLSRVVQHLVKLTHSPANDPRKSWRRSILQARIEVERILIESPSLRREVPGIIADVTRHAIDLAIAELDEHGETGTTDLDGMKARAILVLGAYASEQILGDWFPSEPGKD
jgi:hypothetical protein